MSKKAVCVLMILFIVICTTGCNLFKKSIPQEKVPEQEENSDQTAIAHLRKTVFYFVNEHDLLVPVTKDIPWTEGIGRATLENLVDGNEIGAELAEKGLRQPLPEGTEILGMTIQDGLAKVDFNENFSHTSDETAKQNAINSVIYTLTEFPSIDQVQILVDGKPQKTPSDDQIKGVFSRKDINLETTDVESTDMTPVTLYFVGGNTYEDSGYYIPVTRVVTKSHNQIKTALEELIKGPIQGKGLVSVLPKETKVLDVIQRGSEVVVNFSKEIEEYGGGIDTEHSVVNSVVLTISEFPEVETVFIQVEGQAGALPEGTSLDTPILKPLYVNPSSI